MERVHKHNESQHNLLLTRVSELKKHVDELYIDYHNGDKKLNKRIMAILKNVEGIETGLVMHMEDTQDMDDEIVKGREAIMKLESQDSVKADRRNTIITSVVGGFFLVILTLIIERIIT